MVVQCNTHNLEITHKGQTISVTVDEDTSILDAGLDAGLDLPHDCKMGVCMTCPAKLKSGEVDQTVGMLDEEVQQKGYALLCVSYLRSDAKVELVTEDEVLDEMMTQHAQ